MKVSHLSSRMSNSINKQKIPELSARPTLPFLTVGLIQRTPWVLEDLGPSSLNPRDDAVQGNKVSSNSLPLWRLWARRNS